MTNEYHIRQQQNMRNWNQSYNKSEAQQKPIKKINEKDIVDAEFIIVNQKFLERPK